ncbi:MAG: SUMF1/EgtB/PvdO family nonheme iron enzyme [Xenococcus sp. MO_188.B8]|nr:SUMF1/EgtB/PvdO family nonheme iron enzyme [Xenococcus sp. MO_188.B8]
MPDNDPNSRRKARQKRVQKIIKYLGLGGTGIGISAIVGFLVKGQFKAAAVSALLTVGVTILAIAYKFASGVTNRVLDKIEEELDNLQEPLATWIVNQPKRFFTWSQFQKKYYQSLIDTIRELKTEGFRIGLPVLDLENVFVSLRVVTEIPEKITGAMIWGNGDSGSQEIWDFLAQSSKKKFQAFRRLAVLGPPGSGKTTLLKHLTLIYAKKKNRLYKAPKLIPVLLYLRDFRRLIVREEPPNLPQLIREHIQKLPAPESLTPPNNWIEDQLKIGKFLVMLDGLDEVADFKERKNVSQWLNHQIETYRKNLFILTSRPHGYRSAPVEQVGTVLEVLPFNSQQVKQFIQSWYLQTEIMSRAGRDTPAVRSEAQNNANDLIERIMDNRATADMAKNPLLVTMIATVHYCDSELPGPRVELYQRICDLLLGPRQEEKKIETPLTGEQNKSVLQVLALALMQRKTREFNPSQGQDLIQDELQRVAGSTLTPSRFLKQIQEISGLLVERELGIYEFAHLSFQEYLAAAQVKELQQDDLLTQNLQDPWWAETIRLYAAQSDATNLIRAALENPTVNSLTLALDCLQESLKVEPAIREQLEEMLEAGLESEDPEIAKLAAEVKLLRRLNNLFEIEENLEIDTSYITCAEYQLFVDEWLNLGERFQAGSAKKPITDMSYQNALGFCAWLSSKPQSNVVENQENQGISYYRLPTATEAQNYLAQEHKELGCWTIQRSNTREQGIRVVKAQLPSEYIKLTNYLSAGDWEKADQETASVMGEMAGQESQEGLDVDVGLIKQISPQALHIIGLLWCQYSRGRYGWFTFDVITVNVRGREILRQPSQARYFLEDLDNGVTLEMVSISGGKFMMGSPEGEGDDSEKPQHEVTVQPFLMGKYPITQAQYQQVMSKNPSNFKGDERPVEFVFWNDAVEFCQRLSEKTGKEYRLPTEAEWEYACRAGITTPYHFGETITDKLANYSQNVGGTTAVGNYPPNAFGLYDMHGNVWEWCQDNWHDSYEGAPKDGSPWLSGKSSTKVVRGGSWLNSPRDCRSASRYGDSPVVTGDVNGFRVVCGGART